MESLGKPPKSFDAAFLGFSRSAARHRVDYPPYGCHGILMFDRPTGFHVRKPALYAFDDRQLTVHVSFHYLCRQKGSAAACSVRQFPRLRLQLPVEPDRQRWYWWSAGAAWQ